MPRYNVYTTLSSHTNGLLIEHEEFLVLSTDSYEEARDTMMYLYNDSLNNGFVAATNNLAHA